MKEIMEIIDRSKKSDLIAKSEILEMYHTHFNVIDCPIKARNYVMDYLMDKGITDKGVI